MDLNEIELFAAILLINLTLALINTTKNINRKLLCNIGNCIHYSLIVSAFRSIF